MSAEEYDTLLTLGKRVRLEKDCIVPTHWSWITESLLVGQAPSWVCMMKQPHKGGVHIMGEICPRSDPDIAHMRYYLGPATLQIWTPPYVAITRGLARYGDTWTLPSEMKFAEAIGAMLFNGNKWANTSLIQWDPSLATINVSETYPEIGPLVEKCLINRYKMFGNRCKMWTNVYKCLTTSHAKGEIILYYTNLLSNTQTFILSNIQTFVSPKPNLYKHLQTFIVARVCARFQILLIW